MVASFDRPEQGARSLPNLVAEALGIDCYEQLLRESPTSDTRELVDGIVAEAVERFCESAAQAACSWLNLKAGVDEEESFPTFSMLARTA